MNDSSNDFSGKLESWIVRSNSCGEVSCEGITLTVGEKSDDGEFGELEG
jgi:hypothetical protein